MLQQLVTIVEDRMKRMMEVRDNEVDVDRIRLFKDQQKKRYDRQNMIISVIKARTKTLTIQLKKQYIESIYTIMRQIQPQFNYSIQQTYTDNFLNNLVGLYYSFFSAFSTQFNFKTKLQDLLRPTNHNIINDLIKYLIDFSRDYYQYICYNKYKQYQQTYTLIKNIESIPKIISNSNKPPTTTLKLRSIRNRQNLQFKRNNLLHYDILYLHSLPTYACLDKDKYNLDMMRNKFNDIFRQMKYRNSITRQTYYTFLQNKFNSKKQQFNQSSNKLMYKQLLRNYKEKQDNNLLVISYPFKVSLNVDNNGFINLNVTIISNNQPKNQPEEQIKSKISSLDQKRLSRLQQLKKQYLMNSMKILRMTDGFLPKLDPINSNSQQQKLNIQDNAILFEKPANQRIYKLTRKGSLNRQLFQTQVKPITRFNFIRESSTSRQNINTQDDRLVKWLGKIQSIKNITLKRFYKVN